MAKLSHFRPQPASEQPVAFEKINFVVVAVVVLSCRAAGKLHPVFVLFWCQQTSVFLAATTFAHAQPQVTHIHTQTLTHTHIHGNRHSHICTSPAANRCIYCFFFYYLSGTTTTRRKHTPKKSAPQLGFHFCLYPVARSIVGGLMTLLRGNICSSSYRDYLNLMSPSSFNI